MGHSLCHHTPGSAAPPVVPGTQPGGVRRGEHAVVVLSDAPHRRGCPAGGILQVPDGGSQGTRLEHPLWKGSAPSSARSGLQPHLCTSGSCRGPLPSQSRAPAGSGSEGLLPAALPPLAGTRRALSPEAPLGAGQGWGRNPAESRPCRCPAPASRALALEEGWTSGAGGDPAMQASHLVQFCGRKEVQGLCRTPPALEKRSHGHSQPVAQALTGGERGVTLLVAVFSPSEFVRPVL